MDDSEDVTLVRVSDRVVVGYDEDGEPALVLTTRPDRAQVQMELEDEHDAFYGVHLAWSEMSRDLFGQGDGMETVEAWLADGELVYGAKVPA